MNSHIFQFINSLILLSTQFQILSIQLLIVLEDEISINSQVIDKYLNKEL
jgi:hypothetical protein